MYDSQKYKKQKTCKSSQTDKDENFNKYEKYENEIVNKEKLKTVPITDNINAKAIMINRGGFGKVYQIVKWPDGLFDKSICAQKHTNVFNKDGNILSQNIKEVCLGYQYFKHKNVVNFSSVFINEKINIVESKYIINMQLADMDFNDLIHSNLSNTDRLIFFYPLLKQIINGMSYIHSICLSHGDIKPDNILLFGDKTLLKDNWKENSDIVKQYLKSATIKICDYGGVNMEYNDTMDRTSTIYYRSPELFIKSNNKYRKTVKEIYGPFNDVWSIAITMLEFLTKINIISKLYKQGLKINEKDFFVRFYNCMKSLDTDTLLINSGYDLNNVYVKNIANIIQLMLNKKINNRINMYNLSIYINYYIEKYSSVYKDNNLYSEILFEPIQIEYDKLDYKTKIIKENINIKYREDALNKLKEFMNNEEYCEPNDYQYLPLGLLLFDRLISKNILKNDNSLTLKYMYTKLLFECYYIASRYLLSDIDIIFIIEFLNIDMDEIHLDIIEILKQIEYDIYRPTILTYINYQPNDIYHSQYIIDISVEVFCDSSTINTNYNDCVKYIETMIDFDINSFGNIIKNTITNTSTKIIENDTIKENTEMIKEENCHIPKLKRDDYTL